MFWNQEKNFKIEKKRKINLSEQRMSTTSNFVEQLGIHWKILKRPKLLAMIHFTTESKSDKLAFRVASRLVRAVGKQKSHHWTTKPVVAVVPLNAILRCKHSDPMLNIPLRLWEDENFLHMDRSTIRRNLYEDDFQPLCSMSYLPKNEKIQEANSNIVTIRKNLGLRFIIIVINFEQAIQVLPTISNKLLTMLFIKSNCVTKDKKTNLDQFPYLYLQGKLEQMKTKNATFGIKPTGKTVDCHIQWVMNRLFFDKSLNRSWHHRGDTNFFEQLDRIVTSVSIWPQNGSTTVHVLKKPQQPHLHH